ncbi:MAG: hypothetical protein Q7R35_02080 [Elusimicrobiota bacterium]|nr:hypothetical protein [Elusimicrobiota bacterium]
MKIKDEAFLAFFHVLGSVCRVLCPRRLFACYFQPGEVQELFGTMAGGHGYIGKVVIVQPFSYVFAFNVITQVCF